MDSGYSDRLKRKGWSDLMVTAFERAVAGVESDPGTLNASPLAHYVCLMDAQVTIPWLESVCYARGYVGGSTDRFEEDILKPIVFQHESRLQRERCHIDNVVDHILQGCQLPPDTA